MKWLAIALFAALLLLQYRLWLSNDGVAEVLRLHAAVVARSGPTTPALPSAIDSWPPKCAI